MPGLRVVMLGKRGLAMFAVFPRDIDLKRAFWA
jgi:hypothetical protein